MSEPPRGVFIWRVYNVMIFGGTPEELKEAQERMQMEGEAARQQVYGLLDELNCDQLQALVILLQSCHPEAEAMLAYFTGQIKALLRVKFNMCYCGGEHTVSDHMTAMTQVEKFKKQDEELGDHSAILDDYEVEYIDGGPKVQCAGSVHVVSGQSKMQCPRIWTTLDERMMQGRCETCGAGPA